MTPDQLAFGEETFGPEAAIAGVREAEDAILPAKRTAPNLAAAFWTANRETARDLVLRIKAGGAFATGVTASDLRLPFGGIERDLGAERSDEFSNIKTLCIGPAKLVDAKPTDRRVIQ